MRFTQIAIALFFVSVFSHPNAVAWEDFETHPIYRGKVTALSSCMTKDSVYFTAWKNAPSTCQSPQSGNGLYQSDKKGELTQLSEQTCIRKMTCLPSGNILLEVETSETLLGDLQNPRLVEFKVYSPTQTELLPLNVAEPKIYQQWARMRALLVKKGIIENTPALIKSPVASLDFSLGDSNEFSIWLQTPNANGLNWVSGQLSDSLSELPVFNAGSDETNRPIVFSSDERFVYSLNGANPKNAETQPPHLAIYNQIGGGLVSNLPAKNLSISHIHSMIGIRELGALFLETQTPFHVTPQLWWVDSTQNVLKPAPIPSRDILALSRSQGGILISRRSGIEWVGPKELSPKGFIPPAPPSLLTSCSQYTIIVQERENQENVNELWHLESTDHSTEWVRLAELTGLKQALCVDDSILLITQKLRPYLAPNFSEIDIKQWDQATPTRSNVPSAMNYSAEKGNLSPFIESNNGDVLLMWNQDKLRLVRKPIGEAAFTNLKKLNKHSVRVEQTYSNQERKYPYDLEVSTTDFGVSFLEGESHE